MRLVLLYLSIAPAFACGIIDGDRISGKDVAGASPAFAQLDPQLEIGAAPLPGVERVMRPDELVRLAKQSAIALDGPVGAICFERATEPLTAEKLLPVIRQALALDQAQIEILDFSRFGVPRGTLEFSRSGLMPNGLWRGRVLYEPSHSLPVWVKARITVERTWVEAVEPLVVGKAIEPSQLIVKSGPRFPFEAPLIETPDLLVGRRPVRTIAAGTAVVAAMLAIAHDVERGDLVAVEVKVGSAILDFEATAESSGRAGELIMVKNPENGRSFQATIQDKGHVVIEKSLVNK
jgi:flagella basal body P-ring formation protein FlgA